MNSLIQNSGRKKPRIGLTPLIDVVFILLIFFMLVMSFQRYQKQGIDVGKRVGKSTKIDPLKIIIINEEKCTFNQRELACHLIKELLPHNTKSLAISYPNTSELNDIIKWYQYFSEYYKTTLAVPIEDQQADEL